MVADATIALRAEQAEDRPFLEGLYASTRSEEMAMAPWSEEQKRAFLAMQFDMQHRSYRQVYPDARYDVIQRAGEPVGRLYVSRRPEELRILDIALVSEVRGRGIGGALIAELLAEARGARQVVLLSVESNNRACALYKRFGFRVYEKTDFYFHMEWDPSASAAASSD
jgi:ribosomal protein S18 acetylase RimI-like enzyme